MSEVSLIIPVYNAEKYLRRCMDSVLVQSFTNFELYLINDGSTDKSAEICDEYARADARVNVIHKQNGGAASARNVGICACRGEYLCFADADDYLHPEYIAALLTLCKQNNTLMSMCGFEEVSESKVLIPQPLKETQTEVITACDFIERIYSPLRVHYVVPWAKMYHKSVFQSARYPTDASDEDDCLIHTLAIAAEKIAVCYKLIYFYYIAPGSLSRSGLNLTRWLNTLKYKQDRMDYLQKINRTDVLYKMQKLLFYDLLVVLKNAPKSPENIDKLHKVKSALRQSFYKMLKNKSCSKKELVRLFFYLIGCKKLKAKSHVDFLEGL